MSVRDPAGVVASITNWYAPFDTRNHSTLLPTCVKANCGPDHAETGQICTPTETESENTAFCPASDFVSDGTAD